MAPQVGLEPTTLTLAVPESCYPLGARATFDRGANPFSLHHPPGALGGVAVNSRNASAETQNRNFRSYIKQQNKSGHPFGMSAIVLAFMGKFEPQKNRRKSSIVFLRRKQSKIIFCFVF